MSKHQALGQVALIDRIDVKGAIVTIDAKGAIVTTHAKGAIVTIGARAPSRQVPLVCAKSPFSA